jgi:hypothetical protein
LLAPAEVSSTTISEYVIVCGCETTIEAVATHPRESVTVTWYVPADNESVVTPLSPFDHIADVIPTFAPTVREPSLPPLHEIGDSLFESTNE